jgi:hypothetical protein
MPTRVFWTVDEIKAMLPMALRAIAEGSPMFKAVNIAQAVLPLNRQRKITTQQNIPDMMVLAIEMAQMQKLELPVMPEAPKPVCQISGTAECPKHVQASATDILGAWVTDVLVQAAQRIAQNPALVVSFDAALSAALSRHYMPKDPLAQAATEVKNNAPPPPPKKPPKTVLIVGLEEQYRERLTASFNGSFAFKFSTGEDAQAVLRRAQGIDYAVGMVDKTAFGTFKVLRSAGHPVHEVKGNIMQLLDYFKNAQARNGK